ARVRRERLDVTPLPLGVYGVERERAFARPRQAGYDDQLVARQREIDVLEIVLASALDHDRLDAVADRHRHGRRGMRIPWVSVRARTHGPTRFERKGAVDLHGRPLDGGEGGGSLFKGVGVAARVTRIDFEET